MSEIPTFSTAAKGLARNPLGIIALFIVLIYGLAAMTLGVNSKLDSGDRAPLVWFLVLFPFIVLALFGWLVSTHHEKLYAPSDFRSDEIFLQRAQKQQRTQAAKVELTELQDRVRKIVEDLSTAQTRPDQVAERVAKEVEEATTFIVDASEFLGRPTELRYPFAAFETLGELTDAIYFELAPKVRPFQYGLSWVLQWKDTGETLRTLRMLMKVPAGQPFSDTRTLREAGIQPGTTLVVKAPTS